MSAYGQRVKGPTASISSKLQGILNRRREEEEEEVAGGGHNEYRLPSPKGGNGENNIPRAATSGYKSAAGGQGGSLLAARAEPSGGELQGAHLPFPVGHQGDVEAGAPPQDFSQFVTNWLYGDGDGPPPSNAQPGATASGTQGVQLPFPQQAPDGITKQQPSFEAALNHYIANDPESALPGYVPSPNARGQRGIMKKGGTEDGYELPDVNLNSTANLQQEEKKKKKKVIPASYLIHFPSLNTGQWEDVVHSVMWRVGRYFGFQAFNLNPKTRNNMYGEWVPGTIYCASDHLVNLLVRNGYIRRDLGTDKPEERFAKAVFELHLSNFSSYNDWCKLVGLPPRLATAEHTLAHYAYHDPKVMNGLISELSLYFLIYTEVSSIRHCPELMLFIYWTMSHSYIMAEFWARDLPEAAHGLRNRQVDLRNLHQAVIREVQELLQLHPTRMRPEDCGRMSSIAARLRDSLVPAEDCALVADLVAFGDGGFFCNRIVTPIFYVFSYEVDHLSNLNVDVAHRLGYDDFNESMCDRNIVRDTLTYLRANPERLHRAEANDVYQTMTNLGFERGSVGGFDPQVASDFWRTKVFVKTYRERRTWAAVFRAYYRVYTFLLCVFHLIQTYSFVGWDWRFMSSVILTLSWCKALERICNWFMTLEPKEPLSTTLGKVFSSKRKVKLTHTANLRAHMSYGEKSEAVPGGKNVYALAAERFMERRPHTVEGTPIFHVFGVIEWILLAAVGTAWYAGMFIHSSFGLNTFLYDWWWVYASVYTGVHVLHFLLTTRCGYQVSLTEMLNLPSYFRANSTIPNVTCFMYKEMKIKPKLFILNAMFWALVMGMKVPFDWLIICSPVVEPVKLIWQRHWLSCSDPDEWTTGYWGAPCPGGDWLLAISRIFPFIIIYFMDTSLFFQVAVTLYGILIGIFKLDLGVLSTWSDVVKVFYRAPNLWWHKCMSQMGNENQMAQLRQSLFLKDSEEGGNGMGQYANSVVSDGLMFKKTVLTPEEILGRKTWGGHQSVRAAMATVQEGGTIFSDHLVNDDPTRGSKASALLKGSTNRASQARRKAKTRTSMAPGKGAKSKGGDDGEAPASGRSSGFKSMKKAGKSMSMKPARSGESSASMMGGPAVNKSEEGSKASLAAFFNKGKAQSVKYRSSAPGGLEEHDDEDDVATELPEGNPQKRGLLSRLGQTFKSRPENEDDAMMGQYQKSAAKRVAAKEAAAAAMAKMEADQVAAAKRRAQSAAPGRVQDRMVSRSNFSVVNREGSAPQVAAAAAAAAEPTADEGGLKRMMTGFKRIMTAGRADNSLMGAADRALAAEGGTIGRGLTRATTAGRSHMMSVEHAPTLQETIEEDESSRPNSSAAPRSGASKTGRPASRPVSSAGVERTRGSGLQDLRVRSAAGGRPLGEGITEIEEDSDQEWRPPGPPRAPRPPAPAPPPMAPESDLWWMPPQPPLAPVPPSPAPPPPSEGEDLAPASPRMSQPGSGDGARAEASLSEDTPTATPKKASSPSHPGSGRATSPTANMIERELDEVFGAPLDAKHVSHLPHQTNPVDPTGAASAAASVGVDNGELSASAHDNDDGDAASHRPASTHSQTHADIAAHSAGRSSGNGVRMDSALPSESGDHARGQPLRFAGSAGPASASAELPTSSQHLVLSPDSADAESSGLSSRTPSRDKPSSSSEDAPLVDAKRVMMSDVVAVAMEDDSPNPAAILQDDDDALVAHKNEGKKTGLLGGLKSLFGGKKEETGKKKQIRAADATVMPTNDHLPPAAPLGPHDTFLRNSVFTDTRKANKAAWKHDIASDAERFKVNPRNPSMLLMGQEEEIPEEEIDDVHYQMMMWNAFASAWDDIVDDLSQGDIISEKEVSMLKFVRLDLGSRSHGLRPILLPTFFYAGQIRMVVDTGQVSTAQVMVLSELRMLCVWLGCQIGLLSGKHAHVINDTPFIAKIVNVKHAFHRKKFYTAGIKLVDLMENMCQMQEVPFDMREFADQLLVILTSLEGEAYAIMKGHQGDPKKLHDIATAGILLEVVQLLKREIASDPSRLKVVFKNALMTSATASFKEILKVVRVLKRMLRATVAEATPDSEEAQRVLGFFVNSLSHPSLDKPPSVDKMRSHSVITPLYEEDVLYALDAASLAKELGLKKKTMVDLLTETDDSISLMAYLKAMFPLEWNNFKERMKTLVPDIKVDELSEKDFAPGHFMHELRLELQMWASLRGQLLARTVNGMMRYEKALRLLAKMEHPKPPTMTQADHDKYVDQVIAYKFEYVVTAQTYGKLRDSNDLRLRWLAKSIDILLQRYGRLKAAFLDTAETEHGMTQYSVCLKGRVPDSIEPIPVHVIDDDQPVFELYRVRLPLNRYSSRGVVIGEGKPENQNHATIFAHYESLQAIDMNQDNYLTEAFKMRNLLMELEPSVRGKWELVCDDDDEYQFTPTATAAEVFMVINIRLQRTEYTALVGFREYIFSEVAGALGKFAAATEYAFGTITQRIMTYPARVRLHYGHPDVFNKLFTMSRGGISKATRLLHLTEDVFCGCNHVLRGGKIRYKEYINCGKGRDMGFDSINGFNFKVSGGGGEWAISRESWRMGTRLDFFRLMSFYHSAVGFYINSWLTYCGVYFNIYALLLFAWANATEVGSDGQKVYNVQQVLQLGTLALIPYAGQLVLELGVVRMTLVLFQQIMTGSLLFYMFQQMTVACSFSADLSYGSGRYVGTGRGFNISTMEFVKVFTLYCRSHLYMGFELLFVLTTLYIVRDCGSCQYGSFTWSTWLLAFTLIIAPLWFNPFAFDMEKVSKNYLAWRQWMEGDVDHVTGSNWYTWNTATLEKIRNDNGNNTDNWMNNVFIFISTMPYLLMALAAASRLDHAIKIKSLSDNHPLANGYLVFFMGTVAVAFTVGATVVLQKHWLELAQHKPWRIYRWTLTIGIIAFFIIFLVLVSKYYNGGALNGFHTIMIILYANLQLLIAFHRFATAAWSQNSYMRAFADTGYYTIDTIIGYIMFIILGLLAFLGLPGILQMKLLFNDAFSKTANYGKIAKAMKEAKIGSGGNGNALPALSRPGSAQSGATSVTEKTSKSFDVRSMVRSEHRYM